MLHAPPAERASPAGDVRPALTPGEVAWIVALPCAAVATVAIWLLGPAIAGLLPDTTASFWQRQQYQVRPEDTERARFLIALIASLLLVAAIAVVARRPPRLSRLTAHALVWVAQAAGLAFAVACVVAQYRYVFGPAFSDEQPISFHQRYFTPATLVASIAGASLTLAAVRMQVVRAGFAAITRSRTWALVAAGAAVVATAVWLLHGLNTDDTIGANQLAVSYHLQFTMDEAYAVLAGKSPLVDFVTQYGALWPYPTAAVMDALGPSVLVFTGFMLTVTGLAMLAMYDVLRRAAGSAVSALLLYLPFLATTFFMLRGPLDSRYSFATIFSNFPLRFAGPWLLAWLVTRHVCGDRPRHAWPLFLLAGLVLLNNVDHGAPALLATIAALILTGERTRRRFGRLAIEIAAGLAAALALVSLLTLAREGSLPHLELLVRYARLFSAADFGLLPMPTLGLHVVVYLTFVAALGTATVRAVRGDPATPLTAALAWTGVFGLAAGSYFAGRSHPETLVTSFAPWAFALALLMVVVMQSLARRRSAVPLPAQAACVAAFWLTVCSLAQTPAPWTQVQRLQGEPARVFDPVMGQRFVDARTRPGEPVAILLLLGNRIATQTGVDNVVPYSGIESMPTVGQLEETVELLRARGGYRIFASLLNTPPDAIDWLAARGFLATAVDPDEQTGVVELSLLPGESG